MTTNRDPRAYMIFSGGPPLLVLSTYPKLTHEDLVSKLRYKGIEKFLAYEVDLGAVREAYATTYDDVTADLADGGDVTVLDFNGYQIMANFSLEALGDPIRFGG